MLDILAYVPFALAGVSGVVWAVRLEGRQDKHEAVDKVRFDNIDRNIAEMKGDVKTLVEHLIPPDRKR